MTVRGLGIINPQHTFMICNGRDSMPGRAIKTFSVRARAPLFDTAPFDVIGRPTPDGNGAELWTVTPKGTIAAQATATLA